MPDDLTFEQHDPSSYAFQGAVPLRGRASGSGAVAAAAKQSDQLASSSESQGSEQELRSAPPSQRPQRAAAKRAECVFSWFCFFPHLLCVRFQRLCRVPLGPRLMCVCCQARRSNDCQVRDRQAQSAYTARMQSVTSAASCSQSLRRYLYCEPVA